MHMGTLKMRCQECHTTTGHRIAGMSFSAPTVEGRVRCEKCHGLSPHGVAGALSRHLDDHVRAVACETCHIPSYAHAAPTLLRRDFSAAGQDRPEKKDQYGKPTYDKKFGSLTWGRDLTPVYLWFDGTRNGAMMGEKITPSAPVVLNAPVGEKRNPEARIFPFKLHTAVQPFDKENNVLAIPINVNPSGGFNCYFPMPFRKHARITVENRGPRFSLSRASIRYSATLSVSGSGPLAKPPPFGPVPSSIQK